MGDEITLEQAEMGLEKIKTLSEKTESLGDGDLDNIAGGIHYGCKIDCC